MANKREELKKELLSAKSAEEVAEMVKEAGQEITPEEAAQLWEKVEQNRGQASEELSVDELEAVSGGRTRYWPTDGCAATVEADSWCSSNDYCKVFDVQYSSEPVHRTCDYCQGDLAYRVGDDGWFTTTYHCLSCGREFEKTECNLW